MKFKLSEAWLGARHANNAEWWRQEKSWPGMGPIGGWIVCPWRDPKEKTFSGRRNTHPLTIPSSFKRWEQDWFFQFILELSTELIKAAINFCCSLYVVLISHFQCFLACRLHKLLKHYFIYSSPCDRNRFFWKQIDPFTKFMHNQLLMYFSIPAAVWVFTGIPSGCWNLLCFVCKGS